MYTMGNWTSWVHVPEFSNNGDGFLHDTFTSRSRLLKSFSMSTFLNAGLLTAFAISLIIAIIRPLNTKVLGTQYKLPFCPLKNHVSCLVSGGLTLRSQERHVLSYRQLQKVHACVFLFAKTLAFKDERKDTLSATKSALSFLYTSPWSSGCDSLLQSSLLYRSTM